MDFSSVSYNLVNLILFVASFMVLTILTITLPRIRYRKKQSRVLLAAIIVMILAMLVGIISELASLKIDSYDSIFNVTRMLQTLSFQIFFCYLCIDDNEVFMPGDFSKSFGGMVLLLGLVALIFSPFSAYIYGVEVLTFAQIIMMLPVMISVHGKSIGTGKLFNAMILPIMGLFIQLFFVELSIDSFMLTMAFLASFVSYQIILEGMLIAKDMELSESKIKLLLEQIQPHFIFNSLSAIEELCVEDPEKAEKCVHEFAKYLRQNLDAMTENSLIPLERELEHVAQYVNLEKADPSCEFEITYDIRVNNVMLPALTIEPLVENAIRHGLYGKPKGGKIEIVCTDNGDEVLVAVRDNGNGPEFRQQHKRKGIGTDNVRKRLAAQIGGYLEIKALEVGTESLIHLPKSGMR